MKKILWFGALLAAALLVPQSGDAQNNEKLDKKVTDGKYLRNSVCLMMMTDKSVDDAKRPILKDAFFNAKWNNKYNNHNIANEDRVIDPDLLTITQEDVAAFNMVCQPTDQFLSLKNSGTPAPKQKYYNEAMTQITRSLMSEMAKDFSENGKTTIDTAIRINIARMATKFLNEHDVAKKIAAKWFLDGNNQYQDSLIIERGLMNVTADELAVARGSRAEYDKLVAEKVDFQELVGNTFVVVTRYCYKDKHGVIADRLLPLRVAASYDSSGYGGMALKLAEMGIKASTPDGYYVTVDSYLFRLRWNPAIEEGFFKLFDNTTGAFNTEAFAASTDFALEFIGNERAWVRTKGKESRDMTDDELTYLAAQKAVNAVLAKFEAKYDQFKTKTPLIIRQGEPDKKGKTEQLYTVALGTRDGLEGGEVFDVLELRMKGEEGAEVTKYNKVGELVVDKKRIWNNDEEGLVDAVDDGTPKYTVLISKDKKSYEDKGYLLRMQNKKGKKK